MRNSLLMEVILFRFMETNSTLTMELEKSWVFVNIFLHLWLNFSKKTTKLQFEFDHIFPENTTQETVFQKTATDVIQAVYDGYNGTIFAYGQTGFNQTCFCFFSIFFENFVISRVWKNTHNGREWARYHI